MGDLIIEATSNGALAMRLVSGVWRHLVRDAVGIPYGFREPEAIGEVRWRNSGIYRQPPGTSSEADEKLERKSYVGALRARDHLIAVTGRIMRAALAGAPDRFETVARGMWRWKDAP